MGMNRARRAQAQMALIVSLLVSPLVDVELTELAWFASNFGLQFHDARLGIVDWIWKAISNCLLIPAATSLLETCEPSGIFAFRRHPDLYIHHHGRLLFLLLRPL
jgi:hypothetical protein